MAHIQSHTLPHGYWCFIMTASKSNLYEEKKESILIRHINLYAIYEAIVGSAKHEITDDQNS